MKKINGTILKRTVLCGAILSALYSGPLYAADNTTSRIIGSIEASSMSGITVIAVNTATGSKREISVDGSGSFQFSKLPSGTYDVSVMRSGNVIAKDTFRVKLGANTKAVFDLASSNDEVVTIISSRLSGVDVTTMDSGLTIGEEELDSMPIARNIQSVALLAPGTIAGDTKFSGSGMAFTSFGGSSISENSCYINGLEVTNTRQGLGCGTVPFEFYKEFQVKTGGYGAMYGRATGGVINATTKSGTNEWDFSAAVAIEPDGLREDGQVSRGQGGTGNIFRDRRNYTDSLTEYTFTAAGPIIEDSLFIYAIVNPRDSERTYDNYVGNQDEAAGITEFRERNSSGSDNMFWGTKIDWDINDDHRLSYFAYSNNNTGLEDIYAADPSTGEVGDLIDQSIRERGGEASSLTYTGHLSDDLTITIMTGKIETEYTTNIANVDCPQVVDNRENPTAQAIACGSGGRIGTNFDSNEQTRFDVEYFLGDHIISFGYDYQKRTSTNQIDRMAGDHSWTYDTLGVSSNLSTDGIDYINETGSAQDYVADRIFIGGGQFHSDLSAYYIEDQWQVNDDLLLTAGLRVDEFDSFAVGGKTLLSFKTDVAPRIGFSWDVNGDGKSKLYGTWGHYYLPVANNTIYRVGSGISDTTAYYSFTGIDAATGNPTGISPITGNLASSTSVSGVAEAPDQEVFQAEEADPFSKEEFILGFEYSVSDDLTVAVRGTYRTILTALDDYCGRFSYPHCVMLNPGEASTWWKDGLYWDGAEWEPGSSWGAVDGVADPGSRRTHTIAEIGLPKAKNDYTALQTSINYRSEDLRWNLIYTISKSEGNFEGGVKSDIGQADAGLTQDWDFAALMDGAEGYQANDRRHVLKFFGSYDVTENFSVGMNAVLSSGRPKNIFGQGHPSDDPNLFGGWGDFYYVYQGCGVDDSEDACPNDDKQYSFHPRGSAGRTPWTFKLDLSANYFFDLGGVDMKATLDVFNVLNAQSETSFNEHYESSEGTENQWYGAAYSWQAPRYIRLGVEARF